MDWWSCRPEVVLGALRSDAGGQSIRGDGRRKLIRGQGGRARHRQIRVSLSLRTEADPFRGSG